MKWPVALAAQSVTQQIPGAPDAFTLHQASSASHQMARVLCLLQKATRFRRLSFSQRQRQVPLLLVKGENKTGREVRTLRCEVKGSLTPPVPTALASCCLAPRDTFKLSSSCSEAEQQQQLPVRQLLYRNTRSNSCPRFPRVHFSSFAGASLYSRPERHSLPALFANSATFSRTILGHSAGNVNGEPFSLRGNFNLPKTSLILRKVHHLVKRNKKKKETERSNHEGALSSKFQINLLRHLFQRSLRCNPRLFIKRP